jgi:hypothetical protein
VKKLENQIYLYAIVKSLYEQGEDYIDSFRPYVLRAFPQIGKPVGLNFIQNRLEKELSLRIPLHSLKIILKRAKKMQYLEKEKGQYMLTFEGQEYLNSLEVDNEVQRRLKELLADLKIFLDEGLKTTLSIDETNDIFISFIQKNFEYFANCFLYTISDEKSLSKLNTPEKLILNYIEIAENQKPDIYKTLRDVILGFIISSALNFEGFYDKRKKFNDCTVFFDSNLIFFLLDLYYSEFNKPSKELLNLLKQEGFDLKVFSFTIDEMCGLIQGYKDNYYLIPSTVKVDTIYHRLKKLGWTRDNVDKFIATIEDRVSDLGIQIEWVDDDVDIQHYRPAKDEYRRLIEEFKPEQPLTSQNHDLAAIEKIRKLRKHPVRKLEDSKVFFLTSDHKLCKFDFLGMGHKANGTICEVILDKFLTNILWLKNPKSKIPLTAVIAAHSQELFVKRNVWDRFYRILQDLKREKKIEDEDITMLFYHSHIEEVLVEFDDSEVDKITSEFILDEIEKTSKLKEEEEEKRLREKEKEFLENLGRSISKKTEKEKDEEWSEKVRNIRKSTWESAEKNIKIKLETTAKTYSKIGSLMISIFIGMLLVIPIIKLYSMYSVEFLSIITVLSFLFGGIGIMGIQKSHKYIENLLFKMIYKKKLKEAGLQ